MSIRFVTDSAGIEIGLQEISEATFAYWTSKSRTHREVIDFVCEKNEDWIEIVDSLGHYFSNWYNQENVWLGPVIEETLDIDILIGGKHRTTIGIEEEVHQHVQDIENNLTAGHYVVMFAKGHGNYILHEFPSVTEFDGTKLSLKVVSFQGKYILSELNYDEIEDYGMSQGWEGSLVPTVWFLKVNDNGERTYIEHTPAGLKVWIG